jgi:hypothetical protein
MANSDMVAKTNESTNSSTNTITENKDDTDLPSNPEAIHPLHPYLELIICHLSGNPLKNKAFQQVLPTLLSNLGDKGLPNNIDLTSRNGNFTVTRGKFIQFIPLYQME